MTDTTKSKPSHESAVRLNYLASVAESVSLSARRAAEVGLDAYVGGKDPSTPRGRMRLNLTYLFLILSVMDESGEISLDDIKDKMGEELTAVFEEANKQ